MALRDLRVTVISEKGKIEETLRLMPQFAMDNPDLTTITKTTTRIRGRSGNIRQRD